MGREHFKDRKTQMSGPSNVYFHVLNNNPFTFSFQCVQHRMMTFQMDTVKLDLDTFKSMLDVHKIPLQRLGLPMPLFPLILSTFSDLIFILILYLPYLPY